MARLLYCLLLYLGAPLIWLRLAWRSRRQAEYLQHIGERWGFYPASGDGRPLLWVHAVSVGETRAAQPLLEGLRTTYPGYQILLTCMTPTGRETGQQLYGNGVLQAYLPYDYPGATARFLRHFQPRLGILMETEIWPNLMAASQRARIPMVLANARLSRRSARGYGRIAALVRPALARLTAVAAQTEADANRLALLGAPHLQVCGNLKFDVTPAPATLALGARWREALGPRLVWLAASTREGEEEPLLEIYRELDMPGLLLVLVPRHPQRFDEVAQQVSRQGLQLSRRSQQLPESGDQVWLGDSMGEMAAYYRLADVAFIGGSLAPLGGQNLIEAAACGCPVLVGPHTFNFAQATEDALQAGAALRAQDARDLRMKLEHLLADPAARQAMGEAGLHFTACHQGAATRTLEVIRYALAHRPG